MARSSRSLAAVGSLVVSTLACASQAPPSAAVASIAAQSPVAPLARAAPPKRLAPRDTPGDAEHFADPERRQKLLAFAEQQRPELEKELRTLGAPGFAWGLVVDDALVLSGAEGTTRIDGGSPVTAGTLFRIGSITKVFSALALLRLRDAGHLSLDEPVRRWLPEFDAVSYPSADSPLITPRHLLLHRSGLSRLGNFTYTDPDHPATERDVLGALD
ncbi:MAG TPA: serine hydrolase domain-containing protein, partial [Polyangiaceae bacterium]|nr:serine hydrolase domain-containing protein [Polyangiaceae bacterium]